MVGILLSYWGGRKFCGAMLVSGRVYQKQRSFPFRYLDQGWNSLTRHSGRNSRIVKIQVDVETDEFFSHDHLVGGRWNVWKSTWLEVGNHHTTQMIKSRLVRETSDFREILVGEWLHIAPADFSNLFRPSILVELWSGPIVHLMFSTM